jgi:mRNA interferase HigB
MHVISRKRLLHFAKYHADSAVALDAWYRTTKTADWQNLVELREVYPSADPVGIYTVFNIKGNRYRLIPEINYRSGIVFVRDILTHAEYDKERWKL